MYKLSLVLGKRLYAQDGGAGISFLHSNSYYLTGILSVTGYDLNDTNTPVLGFTDIEYHLHWIRGVLNKHVRKYISLIALI